MNKIKKKDKVLVITGKDRGKKSEVIQVLPKEGKVVVSGVNVVKKAVKAKKNTDKSGIVEMEKPLNASNVVLICPNCNKPAKVGFNITKKGDKERICKACKESIKE